MRFVDPDGGFDQAAKGGIAGATLELERQAVAGGTPWPTATRKPTRLSELSRNR
jgi:hypothetical protein